MLKCSKAFDINFLTLQLVQSPGFVQMPDNIIIVRILNTIVQCSGYGVLKLYLFSTIRTIN